MNTTRSAGPRSYVAGSERTKEIRGAASAVAPISSTAAATSTFVFIAVLRILIPARRPLLRRQRFQAGRPPSALDGLDELLRQLLRAHLRGQRRVVVLDGDELDGHV